MSKIKQYFFSESTYLGFIFGLIFYLTYGFSQKALNNINLMGVSFLLALISPYYSKTSNKFDEWLCFKTSFISSGRIGRLIFQMIFNIILLSILHYFLIIPQTWRQLVVLALLASLLAQVTQYLAISFSNREIGNKNLNIIISMLISTSMTALSLTPIPYIHLFFQFCSLLMGGLIFFIGLLSDLRSLFYPKKGIAIFMGTFNPFHKTHLNLIKNVIQERNLSHVYIHPTVIPKLHRDALHTGKIVISKREMGMRVYKKTEIADVHANYFPTGNRFFEFETRCLLTELSIMEANLESQVSVLKYPQTYEEKGFYGIIDEIKKRYPNTPIHGIHGSDLGGMWIRAIYDESGWIYPYSVKRKDQVSATAIRNGTKGQTSPTVEQILEKLRLNETVFSVNKFNFSFSEGILTNDTIKS